MTTVVSIEDFAKKIHQLLRSDRDVVVGIAGFTGEGKSCIATQLQKKYAEISGTYWGYDRMTWSRAELMTWINGEKKTKANLKTGLRPGQLPEYSAVLPDELFHIFYRRTWFEDEQIGAVATFNMCRDRHLFVCGNVPDFWDLDSGFIKRVRFYIYVPERGRAWVFQQENNPFTTDPWNVGENKKAFRKYKNPYTMPNFICEIHFGDWTKEEKKEYYNIRNIKRVSAVEESRQKRERYRNVKEQRDNCIKGWYEDRRQLSEAMKNVSEESKLELIDWKKEPTNAFVGDLIGIDTEAVRMIRKGDR